MALCSRGTSVPPSSVVNRDSHASRFPFAHPLSRARLPHADSWDLMWCSTPPRSSRPSPPLSGTFLILLDLGLNHARGLEFGHGLLGVVSTPEIPKSETQKSPRRALCDTATEKIGRGFLAPGGTTAVDNIIFVTRGGLSCPRHLRCGRNKGTRRPVNKARAGSAQRLRLTHGIHGARALHYPPQTQTGCQSCRGSFRKKRGYARYDEDHPVDPLDTIDTSEARWEHTGRRVQRDTRSAPHGFISCPF